MSKRIYTTNGYSGYGKQNYYHYEYDQNGDTVTKSKAHRWKDFDGRESEWHEEKEVVGSWDISDPSMPEWLHKYTDE